MEASNGLSSDYYDLPKGATCVQDLIETQNMNFSQGNIFKACYRLGRKAGVSPLYDLNKIKWFTEREIKRVTEGSTEDPEQMSFDFEDNTFKADCSMNASDNIKVSFLYGSFFFEMASGDAWTELEMSKDTARSLVDFLQHHIVNGEDS